MILISPVITGAAGNAGRFAANEVNQTLTLSSPVAANAITNHNQPGRFAGNEVIVNLGPSNTYTNPNRNGISLRQSAVVTDAATKTLNQLYKKAIDNGQFTGSFAAFAAAYNLDKEGAEALLATGVMVVVGADGKLAAAYPKQETNTEGTGTFVNSAVPIGFWETKVFGIPTPVIVVATGIGLYFGYKYLTKQPAAEAA